MKYFYYPGCSLTGTAEEYDFATRALLRSFGKELLEIDDWSCCGASAAEAESRLLALALPARNLALVEKTGGLEDVVVPCSACYLNLKHVAERTTGDAGLLQQINQVLETVDLSYAGKNRVRHLLDVLYRDIGPDAVRRRRVRKLEALTIAPYYGCQCLRPYAAFDDPEFPCSMEKLIEAAGCRVHDWNMGGKCCGASHMTTDPKIGGVLVTEILTAAQGADAIVTVCPMCQMNLEGHQRRLLVKGREHPLTILYLPQLLGLSLGLSLKEVRIDLNLSVSSGFRKKMQQIDSPALTDGQRRERG